MGMGTLSVRPPISARTPVRHPRAGVGTLSVTPLCGTGTLSATFPCERGGLCAGPSLPAGGILHAGPSVRARIPSGRTAKPLARPPRVFPDVPSSAPQLRPGPQSFPCAPARSASAAGFASPVPLPGPARVGSCWRLRSSALLPRMEKKTQPSPLPPPVLIPDNNALGKF